MALAAIPASAMPRFEAETVKAGKAEIEPYWTVPEGYNEHDYNKCAAYLEQTDENGVKNGEKLNETYDPNDPETWRERYVSGLPLFQWTAVNGEQRIREIDVYSSDQVGIMDV